METNIILAGVGGQGILSISYVIDMTAMQQGLSFKQAEVHGMSQRGGAVQSHLRISDKTIYSDLVPKGLGTVVISVEPLESLRYVDYLSPQGHLVTGIDPYINIPDYPHIEAVLDAVASLPNHTLVPAERLARAAGSARAQNMVLLGAASPFLGLSEELLEKSIIETFSRKGERIQRINVDAFRAGRAAGEAYRACIREGIESRFARALTGRLSGETLAEEAVPLWKDLFSGEMGGLAVEVLSAPGQDKISGNPEVPRAILKHSGVDAKDRLAELLFGNESHS